MTDTPHSMPTDPTRTVDILYDVNKGELAVLPDPDLTHQIVADFCKAAGVRFYAIGEPENWDNPDVFRVGTETVPSSGFTVPFSKVREWYKALQLMGNKGTSGEVYYHYRTGNRYTTLFEAIDTETRGTVVVYENDQGERFTRPKHVFFEVVSHEGQMLPRFSVQAPDNPGGNVVQVSGSSEGHP